MTEPKRESLHESLSAAMDDEAEELELRRILNAMRDDPEMRAKWRRLHLIQGAIRGGTPVPSSSNKCLPWLDAATDAEGDFTPGRSRLLRWLGPLTGTAVAAAAAVVVLYFGGPDDAEPTGEPAIANIAAPSRALAQNPSPLDLRRANAYLLQHAQHSAAATRPAAMPFAKVLTTPSGQALPASAGRSPRDSRPQ